MTTEKIFIILLLVISGISGLTQDEPPVTKSSIVENIDGKDFFLHFVKKGETLYNIARA